MCSDTNEDYSIYNQINKTKFGSLPFTIRNPNSIAEANRTPEIESLVGGRSHIRKVPSDHNTNTHTLIGDGRKFYRFSPHLFVVFLCQYCVSHKHLYTCNTPCLALHILTPWIAYFSILMHLVHMHFTGTHLHVIACLFLMCVSVSFNWYINCT